MGLFQKLSSLFSNQPDPAQVDPAQEEKIIRYIGGFYTAFEKLAEHYISSAEAKAFSEQWSVAYNEIKKIDVPKNHKLYRKVNLFKENYTHLKSRVAARNAEYVNREKKQYDELMFTIDGKSLDEQQRTVVVTDAERNLVIAGAGSGKTLTIAGKVKFLCDAKGIAPEDILLIAFTRKSADEMNERIAGKLGFSVHATTFHKLGLDIITEANGKRPDVQDDLNDYVRDYFEKSITSDPVVAKNLIEYFAYYLSIPADLDKFDSLGAAYEAEKGADLETLRGKYERSKFIASNSEERKSIMRTLLDEQVKSLDEVNIANFLFLNGVRYEYERLYPFESDDPKRKAYRPDFYLPDYDIYLEHFGINRRGNLPWLSPVEAQKYKDDMRWKRQFHRQNGTRLLETYSYYSSEGRLTEELETLLKANGVEFKEPDFIDIFDSVYASISAKYLSEFMKLCCTFITLFKSSGKAPDSIRNLRIKNPLRDTPFHQKRTALFLDIVAPILHSYNSHLEAQAAIDFSDMINRAASLVKNGFKVHPYKWVIVDEYQDISVARYKLVHAILTQTGAKLLCVGDDWQSIYRFTGSDLSLFTHFSRYFGSAEIMKLEQTYRNSQQLIDTAGAFVMENPQQHKKRLRSAKSLDYPIAFMNYNGNPFAMLKKTLDKIIQDNGPEASILILGRTNFDFEIIRESKLFRATHSDSLCYLASPTTPISFLTVHRSKGLEADNVVLINFQNDTLGFPNKIADDPLLELVLTDGDVYKYAEERRLLYVALTRTRNRIYILVDKSRPSEFMKEFRSSKSVFILRNKIQSDKDVALCPRCRTGTLTVRKNPNTNKLFVGCSNYPKCNYSIWDTSVLTDIQYCPQCGGLLVKRKGGRGVFYGCSNYPTCNFTKELNSD